MAVPKRLWDKGSEINALVHEFTVGNDPELDRELVRFDCIGSAAHAQMLTTLGILSADECSAVLLALKKILNTADQKDFQIASQLEDGHTAIEAVLTKELRELGEKIHTGRSRNDQIILAMRLYVRHQVLEFLKELSSVTNILLTRFAELGRVPMPGYTHLQPAMPSSVGLWLQAFIEHSLELTREGLQLIENLDYNPLGAAAGFGVPLPLNRELTAKLLGFSHVQRSVVDVQNSRGRFETKFLRWGTDISALFEKLASDLLLFSMREFGFFKLPAQFTTGSSIMPQKQNPDVLELMRGRAGRVRACLDELNWITAKLPSNYHRDFQLTKEPVIRAVAELKSILSVGKVVLEGFSVDEEKLSQAMYPELYATYEAYRLVREGKPFREAYRDTAKAVSDGTINHQALAQDFAFIQNEAEKGVVQAKTETENLSKRIASWNEKIHSAEREVFVLK